jgi:hypothetical protein
MYKLDQMDSETFGITAETVVKKGFAITVAKNMYYGETNHQQNNHPTLMNIHYQRNME